MSMNDIDAASGIQDLQRTTRLLSFLLSVEVGLAICSAVIGIGMFLLVNDLALGIAVSEGRLELANSLYLAASSVQVALVMIITIFLLGWYYKAYKNLFGLKVFDLKWSPVWAVVGWFIPIGNLYIPYEVTKEIWNASSPNTYDPEDQGAWRRSQEHGSIKEWWLLWLIAIVLSLFFNQMLFAEPISFTDIKSQVLWGSFLNLFIALSAFWTLRIVTGVQKRQEERLALIQNEAQLT